MHPANDCAGITRAMYVPPCLVQPKKSTIFPSVQPNNGMIYSSAASIVEIIRLLCTNANAVEARISQRTRDLYASRQ
jgi:hypothetical protein